MKAIERRLARLEATKGGKKYVLEEGETWDPAIHTEWVAVLPRVIEDPEEWAANARLSMGLE